jgi:hypothetical protein
MYNDANLPDDEAWVAMAKDLRETKEARNNLTKENSYVLSSFFSYNTLVLKILLVQATEAKAGRGGFTERGVRDSLLLVLFV